MLKRWLICMLLLIPLGKLQAQESIDDLITTFKILALDSGAQSIQKFNDTVAKVTGYHLEFTDKQTPSKITYAFRDEVENIMKLEYNYEIKKDSLSKPYAVVTFQKITADTRTMIKIYKLLLGEDIDAAKIHTYLRPISYASFKGTSYRYILEHDDFRPGYYMLSLFP